MVYQNMVWKISSHHRIKMQGNYKDDSHTAVNLSVILYALLGGHVTQYCSTINNKSLE